MTQILHRHGRVMAGRLDDWPLLVLTIAVVIVFGFILAQVWRR